MKIVLVGTPGSGKSSLCPVLRERYHVCHLSGAEFAWEASQKLAAEAAVTGGDELERLTVALAADAVSRRAECSKGFILDGFPSSEVQAKELDARGLRPDAVVVLNVPRQRAFDRLSGRWIHASSGRFYHTVYCPPKHAELDDVTGEPLVQRPEDTKGAVQQLLERSEAAVDSVCQYYSRSTGETTSDTGSATDAAKRKGVAQQPLPVPVHVFQSQWDHPSLAESLSAVVAVLDPLYQNEQLKNAQASMKGTSRHWLLGLWDRWVS